jgi:hypothetical protein
MRGIYQNTNGYISISDGYYDIAPFYTVRTFIVHKLVATPTKIMVKADSRKVSPESNNPPRHMTSASIIKMIIPTLIFRLSERN